jgi:hypothetical protein
MLIYGDPEAQPGDFNARETQNISPDANPLYSQTKPVSTSGTIHSSEGMQRALDGRLTHFPFLKAPSQAKEKKLGRRMKRRRRKEDAHKFEKIGWVRLEGGPRINL